MIHPITTKTCVEAWLQAVSLLSKMPGRYAYNVILDIEGPNTTTDSGRSIVQRVDRFLASHNADPLATVAETIFPLACYQRHGRKGVFEDYPEKVYPTLGACPSIPKV
jgi:hypothetical protein